MAKIKLTDQSEAIVIVVDSLVGMLLKVAVYERLILDVAEGITNDLVRLLLTGWWIVELTLIF